MNDTTPAASPPLRQRQTEEAVPPEDFASEIRGFAARQGSDEFREIHAKL
ncbi:hypothetical protein ACIOEZ_17305 [Streptomyces sp. NPDC087866]|nr:hypothetical protein [Streptomyces sp. NBC_01789]MCX4451239.1 hypothetical protein [Streptomyces sp. NBC_01789]